MKHHWPAYLAEFFGTAVMMGTGIGAVVLMWHEGSPMGEWIPSDPVRRLATGILFAGGGTLVVLSPLGQRSGRHLNPAMTFTFWLRKKNLIARCPVLRDCSNCGALLGVLVVAAIAGETARSVDLGLTRPGVGYTPTIALIAELIITFSLIFLVFWAVDKHAVARFKPYLAGLLIALLVMIEAPVSGTSLNPARSFAPAMLSGIFNDFWLYVVGPVCGAVLAVVLYRQIGGEKSGTGCAKLHHTDRYSCLFAGCGYRRFPTGTRLIDAGTQSDRAFLIRQGEVEVRYRRDDGNEISIARLDPGEWVGEMGLLLNMPRSASVVALTNVEVDPLTAEKVEYLIAAHPEEDPWLMRQLAER